MPVEQSLILILGAFAVMVVTTLASQLWVYPQPTSSRPWLLSAAQAAVGCAEGGAVVGDWSDRPAGEEAVNPK
jgi:hypothetical protein